MYIVWKTKSIFSTWKNALAYVPTYILQRWRCSCTFKNRRIGSRTQNSRKVRTQNFVAKSELGIVAKSELRILSQVIFLVACPITLFRYRFTLTTLFAERLLSYIQIIFKRLLQN
jgi:hypothetical protein